MNRVRNAKPLLIEPMRPIFGIIVNPYPFFGSRKEIDMMTERKPRASHSRADLTKNIHQVFLSRDLHYIGREPPSGIDRRHTDPWPRRQRPQPGCPAVPLVRCRSSFPLK